MASQQLKPQFFVTRQNGAMVPLIAMDELPIHVQVQGVARSLSAFEIAGMTGVGTVESRHQYYIIDSMNNTKPIPFVPVETSNTDSATTSPLLNTIKLDTTTLKTSDIRVNHVKDTISDSGISSLTSSNVDTKSSRPASPDMSSAAASPAHGTPAPFTTTAFPLAWRKNTENAATASANPNVTSANPPADPDPEMPPAGQKVYCSYWLRNGECNFAQQGCMYKHVMPLNLKVLEILGFRDLPDWYRKAYKCGSLRVNGGRNGLSYGIVDGNIKSGVRPRTRLDTEASRRAIAAHINGIPFGRNGRTAPNKGGRPIATRTGPVPTPSGPVAMTEANKTNEKDRRDQLLAAAFDADLMSNLGDMMDAEMERIREHEQEGWEEEQAAAKKAAAGADTGKAADKEEKKVGGGAEGKKKPRGAFARRRKVQKEETPN